jgi:hypothetical protein
MHARAQVRKNTQTQAPENKNFRPLYPAAAACGIVSVTALFCMYHAASAITIIGHPFPICKETFPTAFREFHRAFLLLTEKFLEILYFLLQFRRLRAIIDKHQVWTISSAG